MYTQAAFSHSHTLPIFFWTFFFFIISRVPIHKPGSYHYLRTLWNLIALGKADCLFGQGGCYWCSCISVSVSWPSGPEYCNISGMCTCSDFSLRIAPGVFFFSYSCSYFLGLLVYTLSVFFNTWSFHPSESHICIMFCPSIDCFPRGKARNLIFPIAYRGALANCLDILFCI